MLQGENIYDVQEQYTQIINHLVSLGKTLIWWVKYKNFEILEQDLATKSMTIMESENLTNILKC